MVHIDKINPYTPFTQVDAFFFCTKKGKWRKLRGT